MKLKTNEIIFLTAGLVMLFSLPLLGNSLGFGFWILAKVLYFAGLAYFLYNFIFKKS
ncbi:MAG: hypothetical protein WD712_01055 [Candidatus Spechtbacterales bacterium]